MRVGRRSTFPGLTCSIALCVAVWTAGGVQASARRCTGDPHIFVGGTVGIDDLGKPDHFPQLLASCKVGLYIHDYSWLKIDEAERRGILSAFDNGFGRVLELGAATDVDRYWGSRYSTLYGSLGIVAGQAHVNGSQALTLEQWQRYVALANKNGVTIVSPVVSPNSGQWRGAPFESERWDKLRAMVTIGRGVTIDSPPSFFLASAPQYQTFVEQEVLWARHNRLLSTWIISPGQSGPQFLDDTKRLLGRLAADDVHPDQLVVENYQPWPVDPQYPNPIGDEHDSKSILGTALWIARHYD